MAGNLPVLWSFHAATLPPQVILRGNRLAADQVKLWTGDVRGGIQLTPAQSRDDVLVAKAMSAIPEVDFSLVALPAGER